MIEIEKALKELYGERIAGDELRESAESIFRVFKLLHDIEKQNQEVPKESLSNN